MKADVYMITPGAIHHLSVKVIQENVQSENQTINV